MSCSSRMWCTRFHIYSMLRAKLFCSWTEDVYKISVPIKNSSLACIYPSSLQLTRGSGFCGRKRRQGAQPMSRYSSFYTFHFYSYNMLSLNFLKHKVSIFKKKRVYEVQNVSYKLWAFCMQSGAITVFTSFAIWDKKRTHAKVVE